MATYEEQIFPSFEDGLMSSVQGAPLAGVWPGSDEARR